MDALELLTKDHETVRRLFAEFKKAKESEDTSRLVSLKEQIFNELEVHTGIEEEVFYPAAKEVGGEAEELISEGVEEHHVVDVLMGEIAQLQPDDDAWVAKMTVLIENVEHHADEEEEELFPKLRNAFGKERLERIGEELQAAKERRQAGRPSISIDGVTREDLYEQAKERDIPGRSDMSKEELAQALGNEGAP